MRVLLFIIVLVLLSGCEKAIFNENAFDKPENVFDFFWTEFDRQYAFFPYLNLDWDSVYRANSPKIREDMTDGALFNVLAGMSYLLKDGHVNIYTRNTVSFYTGWYEGIPVNQVQINPYLENINLNNDFVAYAKIRGHSIGYMYISSFSGDESEYKIIDRIIEEFGNMKAIIIDVRSNGGGNSRNAETIASRFTDQSRFIFRSRYRNGPEHTDFTPWNDIYLNPYPGNKFLKPVMALSNRLCFSTTEWFLAQMKAIPQATIIGDTTGGGSGNPLIRQLPNGWTFRLSNSQKQLPEGRDYQYTGIYPDFPVWISYNDSIRGIDTILETAIALIEDR